MTARSCSVKLVKRETLMARALIAAWMPPLRSSDYPSSAPVKAAVATDDPTPAVIGLPAAVSPAFAPKLVVDLAAFKPAGLDAMFHIQLTHDTREHSSIQLTPECLAECRLVLRSTTLRGGTPLSRTLGAALAAKTKGLADMPIEPRN